MLWNSLIENTEEWVSFFKCSLGTLENCFFPPSAPSAHLNFFKCSAHKIFSAPYHFFLSYLIILDQKENQALVKNQAKDQPEQRKLLYFQ